MEGRLRTYTHTLLKLESNQSMDIPRPLKIAAVAAGASYVAVNELENRYALVSDLQLAKKLAGYRKQVQRGFAEKRNIVDFYYDTLSLVGNSKVRTLLVELRELH